MKSRLIRISLIMVLAGTLAACATTHTAVRPLGTEDDGTLILKNSDLRVAASALQGGDIQVARSLYDELARLHPDVAAVWLGLGNTYFLAGEYEAADRAYERARQLEPELVDAQIARARVAVRLRQLDQARSQYQAILAQHPGNPVALAGLGVVYDLTAQPALAQQTYRQGLAAHPGNEALRANLGLSLALNGQAREGINVLLGSSGAQGSLPQIRDNLALAYGVLGREDAAEDILLSYQPRGLVQDNLAFYRYLREQHAQLNKTYSGTPVSK